MHLRDGLAEIPAGLSEVRRVAPPPTIAGVNAVAEASETMSSATDVRDISTTGFPRGMIRRSLKAKCEKMVFVFTKAKFSKTWNWNWH